MNKKILALAVVASAIQVTHANPLKNLFGGSEQQQLLSQGSKLEKKTLTTQACKVYEQAYGLGYQGKKYQESNPRENKEFVQAALLASECLTDTNITSDPNKWLKGTLILFELKTKFKVDGTDERLTGIQDNMLKVSSLIKDSSPADFSRPSPQLLRACSAAEIGYKIGYLGDADKAKDPEANKSYVRNGIYYSACMSLIPPKTNNTTKDIASLTSYTILKELEMQHDSREAKALTARADHVFNSAKKQAAGQVKSAPSTVTASHNLTVKETVKPSVKAETHIPLPYAPQPQVEAPKANTEIVEAEVKPHSVQAEAIVEAIDQPVDQKTEVKKKPKTLIQIAKDLVKIK